jgi:hypothetical protein
MESSESGILAVGGDPDTDDKYTSSQGLSPVDSVQTTKLGSQAVSRIFVVGPKPHGGKFLSPRYASS